MSKFFKYIFVVLVISVVSFSNLIEFDRFSINDELKFRPLANGWVSIYPEMHMDKSATIIEKIKNVIDSDLVHGRFRPAFFSYISSSYMLTPIVHDRQWTDSGENYSDFMTGDLRVFSYILLASVAVSMTLLSLVIYKFTGTFIFSLVPIFFIPLSPSLTENLLQNYIDSQEIPLVLWVSLWLFSFFFALTSRNRFSFWGWGIASFLALILALLTKEIAIIVVGVLGILLIAVSLSKKFGSYKPDNHRRNFIAGSLVLSIILSIMVVAITSLNRTGYAKAYGIDISQIQIAIDKIWNCISQYSIHNIYGFAPIFVSCIVLFINRKGIVNGFPIIYHSLFSLSLALLTYGFFTILIPWDPVLLKYTFPSVFFFTFWVAYSLSIIYSWAKDRGSWILKTIVLCSIIPYALLFNTIYPAAKANRDYLAEGANYGVYTIPRIAESIEMEIKKHDKDFYKVLILYQAGNKWRTQIRLE